MADLDRHVPMAESFAGRADDAGRMARSFLAAMRELDDARTVVQTLNSSCSNWERSWATVTAERDAALERVAAVDEENLRYADHIANQRIELNELRDKVAGVETVCEHLLSLKPGHDLAWVVMEDVVGRVRAALSGEMETPAAEPQWDLSAGRYALIRDGQVVATAGPMSEGLPEGWVRLPAADAPCEFYDGQHDWFNGTCENCGARRTD